MTGPLLRASDYDAAPEDDMRAFLYLEEVARERMHSDFEDDQNGNRYYPRQSEYMTRVSGIAAAYGVPGIEYNDEANFDNETYRFMKAVDFQTTQINAQLARRKKRAGLCLESTDKAKIRRALNQIKKCLDEADISEKRRKVLHARIHEFEAELDRSKSNVGVLATAALVILAAGADLKTVGVDVLAPFQELVGLVGQKRLEADEEAPQLLEPPLKLIEPPRPRAEQSQTRKSYEDLDDDIPF